MSTTRPTTTRAVHLASRPHGAPTEDNFRIEEISLPELSDGQILVANDIMSVDPYMRGRMNDVKSYVPPFHIDRPLDGGAVGTVIESRSEEIPEGSHVSHQLGWREHAVLNADDAHIIDTDIAPASAYLSVLGMTGLTAYAGLTRAAEMKAGDAVFVSGAAGAVGSMVGQLARLLGASRVIGSAGTDAKVARLRELGFDAAFNYHDGPSTELLGQAAPDGIDVYYDNVGGDHLEAAIDHLNIDGRVAMCGAISQYNSVEPPCAPEISHWPSGNASPYVASSSLSMPRRSVRSSNSGWPSGCRPAKSTGTKLSVTASTPLHKRSSTCSTAPTPGRC